MLKTTRRLALAILTASIVLFGLGIAIPAERLEGVGISRAIAQEGSARALRGTGIMFIENVGQFDPRARFQARGSHITAWLVDDGLWLTAAERFDGAEEPSLAARANIKVSFVGAQRSSIEGIGRLGTVVSYFLGADPAAWHADVPAWNGVRYVDLYPGLDLEIRALDGDWSWVLVVKDTDRLATLSLAAQLGGISLQVEGAEILDLEEGSGRIRIDTGASAWNLPLLQLVDQNGEPLPQTLLEQAGLPGVQGEYVVSPFAWSARTARPAAAFGTDPVLVYSTFMGGSDWDEGQGIAVNGAGIAFVTGSTVSLDFPAEPGSFKQTLESYDAFVAKVNTLGSRLLYVTFLGGSGPDYGHAIALDDRNRAYVTGRTRSTDFPTSSNAYDRTHNGEWDIYLVQLANLGKTLNYGTYVGGSGIDIGYGIALDRRQNVYLTGSARSQNFPTTAGALNAAAREGDAFVLKLQAGIGQLVYSTLLGGRDWDVGVGIAVDASESAYVTGSTTSWDFPTTERAFGRTLHGGFDAFLSKLSPDGSYLEHSNLLGGVQYDAGTGVSVDRDKNAYVTGHTNSYDFGITAGAVDRTAEAIDAFVVKVNASGSNLLYGTYLGGSGDDYGKAIAVDAEGGMYVTGLTDSPDLPTTSEALDSSYNGDNDVFVIKLAANGLTLVYSTYLGGSGEDDGSGIAINEQGSGIRDEDSAYITGWTRSRDFPITERAFDVGQNGDSDAFVAKLSRPTHTPTPTNSPTATPTKSPTATTISWVYLPLDLKNWPPPEPTPTESATATPSETWTREPTPDWPGTATATSWATSTPEPTTTWTSTATPIDTASPTATPSKTNTAIPTRQCLLWASWLDEEFDAPELAGWQVKRNDGLVTVANSQIDLQEKRDGHNVFPIVWRNDGFPPLSDTMTFETRFRFNSNTPFGVTIGVGTRAYDGSAYWQSEPAIPGIEDILSIHLYRAEFRIKLLDEILWQGQPDDESWHVVRWELAEGEYTLHIDGVEVGRRTSEHLPTSVYLGNPSIQNYSGPWTRLSVDYVRVSYCATWSESQALLPPLLKVP